MPPTTIIAAAITTIAAGGFEALATMAFVKAIAINLVIGLATRALAPKAKAPSLAYDSSARTQSIRQPITARKVIYGCDRTGGAITFTYDDSPAQCTGLLYTWTGHRVKAIRETYFNDEAVPRASDGWNVLGRYNGNVGMEQAIGTESGQPLPFLQTHSGGKWTARHKQAGCAKTYIRMRRVRELFTSGIPNVTVLIDGYDQIWDPRTSTYVYTNNSALCLANYLTNAAFRKTPSAWSQLEEDVLIASANICDERISVVYQPAFTVTAGTDTITFTADQAQLKTGDAVKYHTTSGAAGGLTNDALYYFINTGAAVGQLATTRANAIALIAIDLTSAGSGTQTLEWMPVVTADPVTDSLTFEVVRDAAYFQRGCGVRVETSNTLPTGISAATTYYVIPTASGKIALASTVANAFAGTAIAISDAGTGVQRLKPYDEARYTTNGGFTLDQTPQAIIEQLTAPMAGRCVKIGGVWHIIAGAYSAPATTITEGEMDGPRQVQPMPGRGDSCNGVKGVFVGPENFYQPTDFIPVTNATYLATDNDNVVWREVEFGMVRSHSQARRLAKIELERARQALTIKLQCKISAYRCQPGDYVGVTISRYGWADKAFEVIGSKIMMRGDGDNQRLGVDLLLRETAAGIFDWSATENSAADIAPNTNLPDPFQVASQRPPRVAGLEVFGQGSDTEFTGRDCKFSARHSSVTSAYDIGSEPDPFGAGSGRVDWFVDGLIVRMFRMDGTLLRKEPLIKDPAYSYTLEKNFEDTGGAPVREFYTEWRWHTTYGLESLLPARLEVSNPAPAAVTPTFTATIKGLKVHWDIPNISDFGGFKFYGSNTPGFTPGPSNLLYDGLDNEFTIGNLTKGDTLYYRTLTKDTFGDGAISGESSVVAGVFATASDLIEGAASEFASTLDAAGFTFTTNAVGGGVPIASLISSAFDAANPGPVWIQGQMDIQVGGGASTYDGSINIETFDVKSRYTTGSIASVSTGVNPTVTGSGTGWNGAGLTVGDYIYFGVGKPILLITAITDDTHLATSGFINATFSGSYIIFKGRTGVATGNVSQNAYFGDTNKHQMAAFVSTGDTPTDPLYTERVSILYAGGTSAVNGHTIQYRNVAMQAFNRKK